MDVCFSSCAGFDVHRRTVVVCIITPRGQATRTFGTFTADLEALAAWLEAERITHVAMEATGVYWKPIYNVLERVSSLTLWVVNAQHIKRVPGRKTDVQDAQWLADLLRHGLVNPRLIPDRAQRELRDHVRLRKQLTGARTDAINRIHKTLEASNLQLSQVASDILGVSGRRVLQALIDGETDPTRLADATTGRLQASPEQLTAALHGHLTPVLRHLLQTNFAWVNTYDRTIGGLDEHITAALEPHGNLLTRLATIPGVGRTTAELLLAEAGTDMSRFPTAHHFTAWAGFTETGRSAGRTKQTTLAAIYQRIKGRRGANRAAIAVGRHQLLAAYYIIRDGTCYQEPDPGRPHHDTQRRLHRHVRQLAARGYGSPSNRYPKASSWRTWVLLVQHGYRMALINFVILHAIKL